MMILVTGAHGFIGTNLCNKLFLDPYVEVLMPSKQELDLTNSTAVKTYLGIHRPDVIVHLAANPNNKPDYLDPNSIINDNIISTHNLCYHALPKCRIIFASSISVYGATPYPKKEDDHCAPGTMYGVTKLACEKIIELYSKQHISGVCLRFCAAVGPNMTHGMLHDFYRKGALDGDEFEVFGNCPGSTKPYIHVSDVVKVLIYMIHQPYITYPINILPDQLLSVERIANTFLNTMILPKKLKWLGDKSIWAGDEQVLQVSNTRMKEAGIVLDYKTSFEAIYNTIKDYKYNDIKHK